MNSIDYESRRKAIVSFLESLGITPNDITLYETAFTHSSFNGEVRTQHHDYQRLEFIGDAVVGFTVGDLIYKNYKDSQEGSMTRIRSALVQSSSLAAYAKELGLEKYILIGNGLRLSGGISNKILEDVFESFAGALYEDQSFDIAYNFLKGIFYNDVINFDASRFVDYKTKLQEEMQSDNRGSVSYVIVEQRGPAHSPIFVVDVTFNGLRLGRGEASSKKEAEQLAARDALNKKAV